MRKREQQQAYFYSDIIEPLPPQWHTTGVTASNSSSVYHAHSPTHRSPIHHQPSLSEIVYQDYNNSAAEMQDGRLIKKRARVYL